MQKELLKWVVVREKRLWENLPFLFKSVKNYNPFLRGCMSDNIRISKYINIIFYVENYIRDHSPRRMITVSVTASSFDMFNYTGFRKTKDLVA